MGPGGSVLAAVALLDVCLTPLASAATRPRTPRAARALLPDVHGSRDRPPPARLLSRPNRLTAVSDRSHDAHGSDHFQTDVPSRCSSAECRSIRRTETDRPSSFLSP